jgi:hypothetical protein
MSGKPTIIDEARHISFTIYRILPFIVVAFFFISSILSGDVSGFLILVGVILSSVITILASKSQYLLTSIYDSKTHTLVADLNKKLSSTEQIAVDAAGKATDKEDAIKKSIKYCNWFTLGNSPLSYLPLSTHIYWFLSAYFFYVMGINGVLAKNWFLLLTMSVLLYVDGYYNREACIGNYIVVPILIGIISGVSWAAIVGPKNHMIPLLSKKSQCSAQQSRYSCRIKRTGQVVNTQ